jgi:hypothetical protein
LRKNLLTTQTQLNMLRVLNDTEQEAYRVFMDAVACSVFKESMGGVVDILEHNPAAKPADCSEAIGSAMGQVLLDQIIDSTKYMDREAMIRWFAETAIGLAVVNMVKHPEYKQLIMHKLGLV